MNADERQELPQWIEGLIANHPRMLATEEATGPYIIPDVFWNGEDDTMKSAPAHVSFDPGVLPHAGVVILRGILPGTSHAVEASFLLDELVELTVFALCAESDEEE